MFVCIEKHLAFAKKLGNQWLEYSIASKAGSIILLTIAKHRNWNNELLGYLANIVPRTADKTYEEEFRRFGLVMPTQFEQEAVFCLRDISRHELSSKGLLRFELYRGIFLPHLTRDQGRDILKKGRFFIGKDIKPISCWTSVYRIAQDFAVGWAGLSSRYAGIGIVLRNTFTINDVWIYHDFEARGGMGAGDEFVIGNKSKYDAHEIVTLFHRPISLINLGYAGATRLFPSPLRSISNEDARYYEV